MTSSKNFRIGIIVSALLFVLGVVCWILQLTRGLQLTNLNNYNTWGLYIVGFVLFTGVGAGALLFTSCAWLFEGFRQFRPYTRISSFVGAIGSVIAAGLFIIVDIGNPQRVWYIITSMNLTSPIVWDALILGCYVIIGIIFTRQLILVHQGKKEEKSVKVISIVAFIAGLLVTVTAFIFAIQVARPSWNNPGQPISFLMAAIAVALCMLLIVYAALNRKGYIAIQSATLSQIGKIAAVFLAGELLFTLAEVATGLYAKSGEEFEVIHWLAAGEGAPFFYVELAAIVIGIILLARGKKGALTLGAAVGFFAVLMIKYNLLQSQLLNPLIGYAGPAATTNPGGAYLPSMLEIGVSVGIVGLGALLVLLGLSMLNLGDGVQAEKQTGATVNVGA